METVVSVRDLQVSLGKNFSLTIKRLDLQPHRIYVLTGPNGAGKSTLLRILALLIPPQRGRISLDNVEAETLVQQRRKVTLVEQSPYLLSASVGDNLAFGLKLRGICGEEQRQRIAAALNMVGLEQFGARKARELSGGEIQRVALARALVLEPKVLLLDEPTSSIDSKSLAAFEKLLRRLPEYGVTVVLATHDLLLAERLGGEMLWIENGCLIDRSQRVSENSVRAKQYGS